MNGQTDMKNSHFGLVFKFTVNFLYRIKFQFIFLHLFIACTFNQVMDYRTD